MHQLHKHWQRVLHARGFFVWTPCTSLVFTINRTHTHTHTHTHFEVELTCRGGRLRPPPSLARSLSSRRRRDRSPSLESLWQKAEHGLGDCMLVSLLPTVFSRSTTEKCWWEKLFQCKKHSFWAGLILQLKTPMNLPVSRARSWDNNFPNEIDLAQTLWEPKNLTRTHICQRWRVFLYFWQVSSAAHALCTCWRWENTSTFWTATYVYDSASLWGFWKNVCTSAKHSSLVDTCEDLHGRSPSNLGGRSENTCGSPHAKIRERRPQKVSPSPILDLLEKRSWKCQGNVQEPQQSGNEQAEGACSSRVWDRSRDLPQVGPTCQPFMWTAISQIYSL